MILENKEVTYLLSLLRCALAQKQAEEPPQGLDFPALFVLAKKQQVYNIVCPLIADMAQVPSAEKKIWHDYAYSELVRTIAVDHDRELILADLEARGIDYMPLKGLVLRGYYPKSTMRQMSDNDILYDASKRDILLPILKKYGYKLVTCCENSDDFHKPPFYTFEFHRTLFFDEHDFHPRFDHLWERARLMPGTAHRYEMDVQDVYIYSVAHMYKHYSTQGCGVRFLADLYLLYTHEKENLDFTRINRRFAEMGILDFAEKSLALALPLFEGGELDDGKIRFLTVFMNNGIYGDGKLFLTRRFEKERQPGETGAKTARRYLLRRLFPNQKTMRANYKTLEKKPWLLPWYYIKRLLTKGVSKGGPAMREAREIRQMAKEEQDDA